jgi:hypothetical protein
VIGLGVMNFVTISFYCHLESGKKKISASFNRDPMITNPVFS